MKMKNYSISKEVAHCKLCSKNTATAEIKFDELVLNICDSCLESVKEVF